MTEGRPAKPFGSTSSEHVEVVSGVFTERRFLADWAIWQSVKVVSLQQAVFLSFGVEPPIGFHHGRCWPAQRLWQLENFAIMNLGPGGASKGVGEAKMLSPGS